jgi:subtilase family serine protease
MAESYRPPRCRRGGRRRWLEAVLIQRTHLLVASAAALSLLVAACGGAPSTPDVAAGSTTSSSVRTAKAAPTGGTAECNSAATCYTPKELEVAYGVQPLIQRGIDGRGETVVLPELAQSQLSPEVSDLRQDFAAFDHRFHLPAPRLRVVSTFPRPAHPWFAFGEEVLDAEAVHTIAPGAALTILLVKGNSLDSARQAVAASVAALRLGAADGGIISLSPAGQIGGEHCVTHAQLDRLKAALEHDAVDHVTVVAATGDVGAVGEPCALITALGGAGPAFSPRKEVVLVASDPLVLSVGGTTLDANHQTGAWIGETAWGLPYGDPGSTFQGSGGGFSDLFGRPSYQNGVHGIGARRGVPDVAADADPHTGFPVVTSSGGGAYAINGHGGTSLSAPLWAGIIALADQYAKRRLGFVNPAIYQIARSPRYHQAFHDSTEGNNTAEFPHETITGYRAGSGWDPVTGWGSPNAVVLVPLIARDASR